MGAAVLLIVVLLLLQTASLKQSALASGAQAAAQSRGSSHMTFCACGHGLHHPAQVS
jgi:hypothetical protein